MARRTLARCVLLLLAGLPLLAPSHAQTPDSPAPRLARRLDQGKRTVNLRESLLAPVSEFRGFPDPDTTFADALDYLSHAYQIPFEVNAQAFKDESIDDVLSRPLGREIPKMRNVALSTVLRKVLERIPAESGAMWVVTNGVVEITTERTYHAEFYPGRPNGPFPPLVFANFDEKSLSEALMALAQDSQTSIVFDARTENQLKTPVTARLSSVPLDTALMLLADTGDLEPVEVDGVYYITGKDNAKALREKLGKARPAKAGEPMKSEPAPK